MNDAIKFSSSVNNRKNKGHFLNIKLLSDKVILEQNINLLNRNQRYDSILIQ